MADDTPTDTKRPQTFDIVPFASFEPDLRRLQLRTDTDIAKALGYAAGGTVRKWRTANKAPRVARLALEALVRRQGQEFAAPIIYMIKVDDTDTAKALTTLLKAMSIKWSEL